MKKDDALMNTLNQQIKYLADSVTSLSQVVNDTLDTTVGLTKHMAQLQQDFIVVLNRLNEIELNLEHKDSEPLVMPVIKRKRPMEVRTPYPRKNNHLKRLYYGLRRIVKNHAST